MITISSISEIREYCINAKRQGESIGLVPTMGFLHEGHGSLIQHARQQNQHVIVTLFVNPLQFGPGEDFERYPKSLKSDKEYCERLDVDVLFTPSAKEMYGEEATYSRVHVETLGNYLCGASRPGHFDGVATVVLKFFLLTHPDRAYFGKKDFQQLKIIQKMVTDLSVPVEIVPVSTFREADGLAKSSRNSYLSQEERSIAPQLHASLLRIQTSVSEGNLNVQELIENEKMRLLEFSIIRIDYLTCVELSRLSPITQLKKDESAVCAIAAFVGTTRLIDNVCIKLRNTDSLR